MLASQFASERKPTSASGSVLITPSDTANLVNPATGQVEVALALYCEAAGAVRFTGWDGNTDTWPVAALTTIFVPCTKVWQTGTTVAVHAIF